MESSRSAVLISGGLDSAAVAWWLRPRKGYVVDYGQLAAKAEIQAASAICTALDIDLSVVSVNCNDLGTGSMSGRESLKISPVEEWWPYRNQLLATLVGPLALRDGIETILFASVSTDGSHVDGRSKFFQTLDALFSMQEGGIRIHAPAIDLTSPELISRSEVPSGILGWTHSCHSGNLACGRCGGCFKHLGVLRELGFPL